MTSKVSSFHHNFLPEKKSTEVVEKDIKKWVESVVEFKANLEKQKKGPPLEKHLKRVKKFKIQKKSSSVQVGMPRNSVSGQRKNMKTKKTVKKPRQEKEETPAKKEQTQATDAFDMLKESFRNLKLPQNWTSGVSSGRVVFNRVKVTTLNAQQKVSVEKSLIITKDRNAHALFNGTEVNLNNLQKKIDTVDDIKKAIKEIDNLKVCEGPANGPKSPQCAQVVDSKLKTCQACKSEITNPPTVSKSPSKKNRKIGGAKGVSKQRSFQK